MRKSFLILLSIATLSVTNITDTWAQDSKNKISDPVSGLNYEKKLRWADGLYQKGSFFNAVEYYHQLLVEQPRNPYLNHQIAECYKYLRDYGRAAKYYGMAYELASMIYPHDLYEEAVMLKMNDDYDKSEERFKKYIALNKKHLPTDYAKNFKKWQKRAQLEIDGIEMGRVSKLNPEPVNVKNVGPNINTTYTQSAPIPIADTVLMFSTQNITSLNVADRSVPNKEYLSKLMVSRKQKYTDVVDTFEWALDFNDGKFNSTNFHVGNGVFSPGGDRFYFTKCKEADSNRMLCKIFVSEFQNDRWGTPNELGNNINIDGTSSTTPYIAKVKKQEVLFFASDRKMQGRGGFDIWYSVYDPVQKSYRRPQNAGKQINTAGDEKTPYYDSRTGTLYFASNGWKTLGGFDIYSAKGGPSRYEEVAPKTFVRNLGYPINTTYDDMYYVLDNYGKPDGYLVSNRPRGNDWQGGSYSIKNPTCCDDIWRVQYEPRITIQGVVLNSKTQKPVNQVSVKMVDDAGEVKTFNSTDGRFEFNASRNHTYVLNADKQDFKTTRTQFSTMGMKREDPDKVVELVIYVDSIYLDETFIMENVFYDFGKSTLRPESSYELDKLVELMKDNPSIDVQIISHTDNVGTDESNNVLSNDRAQSVINYLVSSGIERSRLSSLGLGESQPVASNDTEEGRQKNRRTEFKIIADRPERRQVYDSSKPGTLGQQMKNLQLSETDNIDGTDAPNTEAPSN